MKRLMLASTLVLSLLPASARAQVDMQINIGLPIAPPLVVVQPGIQVVENQPEEVFFVGGWYWCRRGDYWYRARGPRAAFVYVEPYYVPTRLAYLPPPGHYRHWNRERMGEERHWWKEHDHDRRRAWREHDERRSEWKHEHDRGEHRGWDKHGDRRERGSVIAPAREYRGAPAPALARPAERERGRSSVLAPSSSDRGNGPVLSRPPERGGHPSVIAPADHGRGDRHRD